jgi:short-subunit dehydrogenase
MSSTRSILITGGGSGIGLELARLLASREHSLILVGRDAARLQAAANELRLTHGTEVHVHSIDLSEPGAAQRMFEHTQEHGFLVDTLINNAGFGIVDAHADIEPAQIYRMLQLNVVAVAELCRLYGELMKQRRAGRILNIASTAAFQPTPYFAAYGASKAFVLNFSEALAKEMEDYGVSVSCLAPGPTDTAFFNNLDPQRIDEGHFFGKKGRGDPRMVAQAGIDLMVRGGLTQVVGAANKFMVFSNRFAPRAMVAALSKRMLRPSPIHSKVT